MSSTTPNRALQAFRRYAVEHPIGAFLRIALPVSWTVLPTLVFLGVPIEFGIIFLTFGALLCTASIITYWRDGRAGLNCLFGGLLKWRVGVGYYCIALFAIPAITILISVSAGAARLAEIPFARTALNIVSGAVIINLWEETAWTGFVQSKLMQQRGLFIGSLLTAPAFAGIHLPLLLEQKTASAAAMSLVVLFVLAAFIRCLIGMLLADTGGSLLIVGLVHASFNGSNALGGRISEWASIIALVCLTLLVAGYRVYRGKSLTSRYLPAERAAGSVRLERGGR
jgi:hypothetical protein